MMRLENNVCFLFKDYESHTITLITQNKALQT